MIQGKILSFTDDLSDVYRIRESINVKNNLFMDDLSLEDIDKNSIHALVYVTINEKKPVATGSLYYDGDRCFIYNLVVLKEHQGKRYGDFTVRMLLNKAFLIGIKKVYVKVPEHIVEFFQKLGFVTESNIIELLQANCIVMVIEESNLTVPCRKEQK